MRGEGWPSTFGADPADEQLHPGMTKAQPHQEEGPLVAGAKPPYAQVPQGFSTLPVIPKGTMLAASGIRLLSAIPQ